jgi:hypothetical protein
MRLLGRPVSASAVSCSRPTLRRSGRFVLGHVAQHLSRTPVGPEPGERGSLRPAVACHTGTRACRSNGQARLCPIRPKARVAGDEASRYEPVDEGHTARVGSAQPVSCQSRPNTRSGPMLGRRSSGRSAR